MLRGIIDLDDARAKQREVSTSHVFVVLADCTYAALGDVLLKRDGSRDRLVYGADHTSCWYAEIADEVQGTSR